MKDAQTLAGSMRLLTLFFAVSQMMTGTASCEH